MKNSKKDGLTKSERIIVTIILILFIPVFIAGNILTIEAASYSIESWKAILSIFILFTFFICFIKFSPESKRNLISKMLFILWFVIILSISVVLLYFGIHINFFFI